jgi:hypothetical protein
VALIRWRKPILLSTAPPVKETEDLTLIHEIANFPNKLVDIDR